MVISFVQRARLLAWLGLGLVCVLLCACKGVSPVFDTAAIMWSPVERNPKLSAEFEYLQVELDGRVAYMALGRREVAGADVREFWYSGQREMLQLLNGRIEQVLGMTREVRYVTEVRPEWFRVLDEAQPVVWQRRLDLMPGYQYGVLEFVTTAKAKRLRHAPDDVAASAQWLTETVQRQEPHGRVSTYLQWFALQQGRVVYSEQCLAADMCFKLKHLGAKGL